MKLIVFICNFSLPPWSWWELCSSGLLCS